MTTPTPHTVGQQLMSSEALHTALDAAVAEITAAAATLTDVRPPLAELKEDYEHFMARAARVRGRGLLYPYIGSGIGNGALVELLDGSVKWDMICGIGVNFFGHSHPVLLKEALLGSAANTVKNGNLQTNFEAFEFGEVLVEQARKTSSLTHAFATTGGALANENALKICFQKHAPASRVIAFKDCFMGRTITMTQIGDSAAARVGIPLSTQVDYMPFYDRVAAERMGHTRFIDMAVWHLQQYIDRYPKQHACFIFELVQGEGGFNTSTRDYFKALMECCKDNDVAVWDDEIQTFGRTERMFAYEMLDLGEYIDVLTIGKMTQACVTLFTEGYNPKPGLLSATFTGEGSSFRVGTAMLRHLIDSNPYGPEGLHAKHHHAFREQVRLLAEKHPDWFAPKIPEIPGEPGVSEIVGGVGGMMRFTPFGGDKKKIIEACHACFHEGVVIFFCGHGPYHLRMLPPLGVMDIDDWPRVFECLERGLARVANG